MKHKVLIVGAGRIGCGYGWPSYPFVYTHLEAWAALSDRVETVGVCDTDEDKLVGIQGITTYPSVPMALSLSHPDVVSVCVPPEAQEAVVDSVFAYTSIKGIWCEKPFVSRGKYTIPIQVNYIRRFDIVHQMVRNIIAINKLRPHLHVWAKDEIHTKCHFDDLMKFWGCSMMTYIDNSSEIPGTNSYRVDCGKWFMEFRNGGVSGDFMVNAARNLLDHIDYGTPLISPAY